VELREGSTSLGNGTCSGGTVAITSSVLGDGVHAIGARNIDTAGNGGTTSSTLSITVDTSETAPGTPDLQAGSDSGTSSTDNLTNLTNLSFDISCTTGDSVTLLDGGSPLNSGTCAGGTVTISSGSLSPGSHTIAARQTDAAGNTSSNSS